MTFESGVLAFAERFLSDRTAQLIVAPALADLQFAGRTSRSRQVSDRAAVLRAVAGGLCDELAGASGHFVLLTLVPATYFVTMLVMFVDFFTTLTGAAMGASLVVIALLSLAPAMICCWPERRRVPRID